MCSAAPSIGKGPSIQRSLSGHSGHGRTRCWPAPVAIDPKATFGTTVLDTSIEQSNIEPRSLGE
jgi:hypothetical protein